MGRAGRKRKQGKRTKSGQLSRAGERVKPSEWVERQQDRFGNHYSSALGRAYASGLLGEGNEAKTRLDAGNKFALRYSKIIGGDAYTCPLDRTPKGSNDNSDSERERHQQKWLFDVMDKLDRAGARPWLDQLIHKNYTDIGPHWLDDLLVGRWNERKREWSKTKPSCIILAAAVKALDIVAGVDTDNTGTKAEPIPFHQLREYRGA